MGLAATGNGAYREADDQLNIRANTYDIVIKTGYLLGVNMKWVTAPDETERDEQIRVLQQNKPARILRNLCLLRSQILREYTGLKHVSGALYQYNAFITQAIDGLAADGIQIHNKNAYTLTDTIVRLNKLICDRVNNIKALYPDWIRWDYIRDLFIMQDGFNEESVKAELATFKENISMYPYGTYLNWKPSECGNILYNDEKFVNIVYSMHGTAFREREKVHTVSSEVVGNITGFVAEANKVTVLVDCENSDPYKLCTAFNSLRSDIKSKISKFILCDDRNTGSGWNSFGSYINIPCERMVIDRIKTTKSLVDMTLCTTACKQFYQEKCDSFIIVSSDSDYWALFNTLSDARFLVMVERKKCGADLKEALTQTGIFYCYIDDFYTGDNSLMKAAVTAKVQERIDDYRIGNLYEYLDAGIEAARAKPSPQEREGIYQSIFRDLEVVVDDDGNIYLEIIRKK